MERDITAHKMRACQCSQINSVLFVLWLPLSFTPLAVFIVFFFFQTSCKHCHWTITDSAQMTSEIALFPLFCAHMSQMLFGASMGACQTHAWHAISNRADCAPFALILPLFIYVGGGHVRHTKRTLCRLWPGQSRMWCSNDSSRAWFWSKFRILLRWIQSQQQ